MKVGLDPGHGGQDPGAVSPIRPTLNDQLYTEEADITLAIAKRCQGILLACGHETVMTRTADADVGLVQRTNLLNKEKVDIAVSIHLNSTGTHTANYIATFIQAIGGQAEKLAKCTHPLLVRTTGWPDGGVRTKNLHMTRETKMPAVLLELGFVSNPVQEKMLVQAEFQGTIAAAIAEGVLTYAGGIEPWQRSLLAYATNSRAGQDEIIRAQGIYKLKQIHGDKAGMKAAHNWADQVRQAMGQK